MSRQKYNKIKKELLKSNYLTIKNNYNCRFLISKQNINLLSDIKSYCDKYLGFTNVVLCKPIEIVHIFINNINISDITCPICKTNKRKYINRHSDYTVTCGRRDCITGWSLSPDNDSKSSMKKRVILMQKSMNEIDEQTGLTKQQISTKKMRDTKLSTVNSEGLNIYEQTGLKISEFYNSKEMLQIKENKLKERLKIKKAKREKFFEKDDDGLNHFQRISIKIQKIKSKIDPETGLSINQVSALKGCETKNNTIDPETGLNTHQLIGVKIGIKNKTTIRDDGLTNTEYIISQMTKSRTIDIYEKAHKTKYERGIVTTENMKVKNSPYWLYRKAVEVFTRKSNIKSLKHFEKRGKISRREDAHHLDHKFSIMEGFKNNIPPYIIGSIYNLEFIPARENYRKSSSCSITIDDLCDLYFKNL